MIGKTTVLMLLDLLTLLTTAYDCIDLSTVWVSLSSTGLGPISKVKNFISPGDQEKLIHAFITSRVAYCNGLYCNGLFTGLPQKTINPLQMIQNAAARLLTRTKKRHHIAQFPTLPVTYRIDFKALLLVFKPLNGQGPL